MVCWTYRPDFRVWRNCIPILEALRYMIKIKRVYESFDKNDGFRILVDRLWPRGLTPEPFGTGQAFSNALD